MSGERTIARVVNLGQDWAFEGAWKRRKAPTGRTGKIAKPVPVVANKHHQVKQKTNEADEKELKRKKTITRPHESSKRRTLILFSPSNLKLRNASSATPALPSSKYSTKAISFLVGMRRTLCRLGYLGSGIRRRRR